MTIVTAAAAVKEDLIEMGAPHLISMYDCVHCTLQGHHCRFLVGKAPTGSHIPGVPPLLPPYSISHNPGKTAVLPVLPLVSALHYMLLTRLHYNMLQQIAMLGLNYDY